LLSAFGACVLALGLAGGSFCVLGALGSCRGGLSGLSGLRGLRGLSGLGGLSGLAGGECGLSGLRGLSGLDALLRAAGVLAFGLRLSSRLDLAAATRSRRSRRA
jgi:hypothetical protein